MSTVKATGLDEGSFSVGDVVQILSNQNKVEKLEESHGGWLADMKPTLGKIGIIAEILESADLTVALCGTTWVYNPKAVFKIESASSNSRPSISKGCIHTDATIKMKQERSGNTITVKCTVYNKPEGSFNVKWFKENEEFSAESLCNETEGSTYTESIRIGSTDSEYAGWYTCELRNPEGLAATGAIEVLYEATEETTPQPETETTTVAAGGEFEEGDVVQVLSDEATVKKDFGDLDYDVDTRRTLGKIGMVIKQDSVHDVLTRTCGTTWWYKPNTLIKLASAGSSSAPEISSDCVWSNSTVSISQYRTFDSATLICTVVNKPVNAHVSWKKHGTRISRDSVKEIDDYRITIHSDFSSKKFIVQIDDTKPEDAGWYTCEVTTKGEVAATAATKLEIRQLPSVVGTSTRATVTEGKFVEGDLVRVLSDMEKVKELEEGHGGWVVGMEKALGKIGQVFALYNDDLRVKICNTSWLYHPQAIIKIASAGDSAPEISSNCLISYATAQIKQQRVGNVEKLTCTIDNEPTTSSYVSWVKDGVQISNGGSLQVRNPRIKIHSDYSSATHTLEIANMKPEDAGWYTCELRNSDNKLFAVDAVQLVYQPHAESITPTSAAGCAALPSIQKQLLDVKYLITKSTSILHSKLNDVIDRLAMAERRFSRQ